MGYICEILSAIFAEKFLDEDYIQKLNTETENVLKKLDAYIPNDEAEEEDVEEEECNFTHKIQNRIKPNKAGKKREKCGKRRYIAEYQVKQSGKH